MSLSSILVFILISTGINVTWIQQNEVTDMQMCKLDEKLSLLNATMVENPDIYVTCIHHTDGLYDYYYDSIPAKDCRLQEKYVEMNVEKDEQLDKDVCPLPGRWPKCDISEGPLNVTLSIPRQDQSSSWFLWRSYVVQLLDYFTMPTFTWRIQIQDLLQKDAGVQDKHVYNDTRNHSIVGPATDTSVNTTQLTSDSDQGLRDEKTLGDTDVLLDHGFHSYDLIQRSSYSPATAIPDEVTRVDTDQHQDHLTSHLEAIRLLPRGSHDNYGTEHGKKVTASSDKPQPQRTTVDPTPMTPYEPSSFRTREPKPRYRTRVLLNNNGNHGRNNYESRPNWRRLPGREELEWLYKQILTILHAITPTPSDHAILFKDTIADLMSKTQARALYLQKKIIDIYRFCYLPVGYATLATIISVIFFHCNLTYLEWQEKQRELQELESKVIHEETKKPIHTKPKKPAAENKNRTPRLRKKKNKKHRR